MSQLQQALENSKPLYFIPRDDVAADVLIPALGAADSVDCMMGFFSSQSFSEIAPGLATFLTRSEAPLRLVVSPYLNKNDQAALRAGIESAENVATSALILDLPNATELTSHTLACLSWLIRRKRVEIKIALMRGSLFHPKVWLFRDGLDAAALHGSMNMTKDGISRNREQVTLSRAWKGSEAAYHVEEFDREFEDLWNGRDPECLVVDLPDAIRDEILMEFRSETAPTEEECTRLWRKAHGLDDISASQVQPARATFSIPDYIAFEDGEFAHQGRAVEAWRESNWRGVLEMATGSGKTITAMIGAYQLYQEVHKLLIVVAAPYVPLVQQWCGEVEDFGLRPIDLTRSGGPARRRKQIRDASRRLRFGLSEVELLVVSNDTLSTDEFISDVAEVACPRLLIADECHNLGTEGFSSDPPDCFEYRLGLSATPVRQYDSEGTDRLFAYFGDVCFEFTLEDAIGKCLTEYDYHVHFAELTGSEMDEWVDLSAQISSLAWKISRGDSDAFLDNLLRQRRLVLETASAKLGLLRELLSREEPSSIQYTLIYATDKDPGQLQAVNDMLTANGVLFHQLTYEETSDRAKVSRILKMFQEGSLQVLTAKRVLDEGVNIPQIERAFLLASTTVTRQWVQRRGRLLRKCDAIGKTCAVIHDFVVLPPDAFISSAPLDVDARKIVRGERNRVWEFAHLARNRAEADGPYVAVERLDGLLKTQESGD